MDKREKAVVGLARNLEHCDGLGVDTASSTAEVCVEAGVPDVGYEALLYAGVPAPEALDTVLLAADKTGVDRGLCFEAIAWRMEPYEWLEG